MTWSPIWNLYLNRNPVSLRYLSATSFLSFGVFALSAYISRNETHSPLSPSTDEEEEEMNLWSQSLSDPQHKNYNTFSLNPK